MIPDPAGSPWAEGCVPPAVSDHDRIPPIGEGGSGRVWLARNRATGKLRAVKAVPLRPCGQVDPAGREVASILHLEASLRRRHPDLLCIHQVGKTVWSSVSSSEAPRLFYYGTHFLDFMTGAGKKAQEQERGRLGSWVVSAARWDVPA